MHADYDVPALRELRDQQVRFAPRDKRLEQLDRAEKLIHEIEADTQRVADEMRQSGQVITEGDSCGVTSSVQRFSPKKVMMTRRVM